MPSFDPILALQSIGYTDREAAFLYLVAVHSGYFLRRQYCRMVQRNRGAIAHQLIRRARAMGHVRSIECGEGRQVYHLAARPIYQALGMDDSQSRRLKGDGQIKARLMILDFVLDHLDGIFLRGEQEKVEYFVETFGIQREFLPHSQVGGSHFFPDAFPILIGSRNSNVSNLSFTFFDEGLRTTKRFERYLNDYDDLFSELPRFELIYGATEPRNFDEAQRVFTKRFPPADPAKPKLPYDLDHFLSYMRVRAAWESGAGWPNARGAALLQEGDRIYRSERHEQIFRGWRAGSLREDQIRRRFVLHGPRAVFTSVQLRYCYPLFGFRHGRTEQPEQQDTRSSQPSGQLLLFNESTPE